MDDSLQAGGLLAGASALVALMAAGGRRERLGVLQLRQAIRQAGLSVWPRRCHSPDVRTAESIRINSTLAAIGAAL
jgi:hypothetical protein